MEQITLDKSVFDEIKPLLEPYIKDHCNYCGIKITKKTFGLLSREITCCSNMVCLIQAIEDMEEMKKLIKIDGSKA